MTKRRINPLSVLFVDAWSKQEILIRARWTHVQVTWASLSAGLKNTRWGKFVSADHICRRTRPRTRDLRSDMKRGSSDGLEAFAPGSSVWCHTPQTEVRSNNTCHASSGTSLQAGGFLRSLLWERFSARYYRECWAFLGIGAWKQEKREVIGGQKLTETLTVNKDLFIYLRNVSAHARIQLL